MIDRHTLTSKELAKIVNLAIQSANEKQAEEILHIVVDEGLEDLVDPRQFAAKGAPLHD